MVTSSINQVKVSLLPIPMEYSPTRNFGYFPFPLCRYGRLLVKELGWHVFCLILAVREQGMFLILVLRTFETNNK